MVKSANWQEVREQITEHSRILFSCCGNKSGPFVIFSGGIHGNEPSGVLALKNQSMEIPFVQIIQHGTFNIFVEVDNHWQWKF